MSDATNREEQDCLDEYRRMEAPNVTNRDNDLLQPLRGIGGVDEVNGRGATELPEFVPTQLELLQLVKYWANVALDIEFFWFCSDSCGSSDLRLQPFAYRRINRIAECLGDQTSTLWVSYESLDGPNAAPAFKWAKRPLACAGRNRRLQQPDAGSLVFSKNSDDVGRKPQT